MIPRRKDIGPGIDGIAPRLLGRHVEVLALDHAGLGFLATARCLSDAEVDDLHLAGMREQDVLWADVAMDDGEGRAVDVALAVGVIEPCAQLLDDVGRDVDGHVDALLAEAAHDPKEIRAVDILHRNEVALIVLTEIKDLGDVDVVEAHRDLRFVDQHLDELIIIGVVGWISLSARYFSKPATPRVFAK